MSPVKKPRFSSTNQGELFEQLAKPLVIGRANAPDLDIGPELLGALRTALRESDERDRNNRHRIADRMNLALPEADKPITKRQVDAWMAKSKEFHELPARLLPALCWALGTEEPLRLIARALGYELVDAHEAAAKRLGQAQLEIARLRREAGVLTKTLGG